MSLTRRDLNWDDVLPAWGPSSSWRGDARALRLVPVYSAVSFIADTFSMIPQYRYRQEGSVRHRMDLPVWLSKPDSRMQPMAWRYQFATSLKLRGNAYGLVLGSSLTPLGIRWLHPDSVRVDESDPSGPQFYIGGSTQPQTLWSQGGQMIHVAEFVQPGSIVGLSPIAQFKQVWETAHHAVAYGHDWFEKSGVPAALLMAKSRLKPGDAAEARKLFKEAAADGLVTLDQDWDYKQLTVTAEEAQFLQTIKASATMIANIFRVPPEDVGGEVGSSRSYGNREADAERFNLRTMQPLGFRYIEAMTELLPRPQFIGLDFDVLTRPSLLDLVRARSEQLRTGQLFHDEMRSESNRPPATKEQIAFWRENYQTQKTMSESISESITDAIKQPTKEG